LAQKNGPLVTELKFVFCAVLVTLLNADQFSQFTHCRKSTTTATTTTTTTTH